MPNKDWQDWRELHEIATKNGVPVFFAFDLEGYRCFLSQENRHETGTPTFYGDAFVGDERHQAHSIQTRLVGEHSPGVTISHILLNPLGSEPRLIPFPPSIYAQFCQFVADRGIQLPPGETK